MQRLVPNTSALPCITPKDWGKGFFPVRGKIAIYVYSEECNWVLSRKFTLWSYATPHCHSCAQTIHGNARVWMKSFFSCFGSKQYNPSSVRFPAVSMRNQQSRAPRPTLFPKGAGFHIPVTRTGRRLFYTASGGRLSPLPWRLIVTVWSGKCFSFWVMVALTLVLRRRNSSHSVF